MMRRLPRTSRRLRRVSSPSIGLESQIEPRGHSHELNSLYYSLSMIRRNRRLVIPQTTQNVVGVLAKHRGRGAYSARGFREFQGAAGDRHAASFGMLNLNGHVSVLHLWIVEHLIITIDRTAGNTSSDQ